MTDNLAVGVRLRESDLPLVSRGGGASTTRLVNRSIGAKTILNGINQHTTVWCDTTPLSQLRGECFGFVW